jgi:hypothetical protein
VMPDGTAMTTRASRANRRLPVHSSNEVAEHRLGRFRSRR